MDQPGQLVHIEARYTTIHETRTTPISKAKDVPIMYILEAMYFTIYVTIISQKHTALLKTNQKVYPLKQHFNRIPLGQ